MRKLILWNIVTLDGLFEGEKAWDLSFHKLVWGKELEALSLEQLQEADMLVFGEKTYTGMAAYWQNAGEDDAKITPLMNRIAKVVCSQNLGRVEWNNTSIVRDAVKELSELKKSGNRPMYIFGSANLSESLMIAGLIDEIRLCVAPIVLGKGRRLFNNHAVTRNLGLLEARTLSNGGVFLRYECRNKD